MSYTVLCLFNRVENFPDVRSCVVQVADGRRVAHDCECGDFLWCRHIDVEDPGGRVRQGLDLCLSEQPNEKVMNDEEG
jgi:hypothetical protein